MDAHGAGKGGTSPQDRRTRLNGCPPLHESRRPPFPRPWEARIACTTAKRLRRCSRSVVPPVDAPSRDGMQLLSRRKIAGGQSSHHEAGRAELLRPSDQSLRAASPPPTLSEWTAPPCGVHRHPVHLQLPPRFPDRPAFLPGTIELLDGLQDAGSFSQDRKGSAPSAPKCPASAPRLTRS